MNNTQTDATENVSMAQLRLLITQPPILLVGRTSSRLLVIILCIYLCHNVTEMEEGNIARLNVKRRKSFVFL